MPVKPPINEKFVAYGGPGEALSTELVGRIVHVNGVNLFIVPDKSYEHLVIEGNRRRPKQRGEEGKDYYHKFIVPAGGGGLPIIKCETYSVGARPTSDVG